jgi:hypothetical protein
MVLATLACATLGLGLQSVPAIPPTFTAVITSNTTGTAQGPQKGVSTITQYYDYANKRLRKDAGDGTTKIYRYDVNVDPPLQPGPNDPHFPTPKGYQFQLSNPNMTCCWLWLMDSDTKDADRMYQLQVPKKAQDAGSDKDGEHWASVSKFPFLQTDDYWFKNGTLTKENNFVNLPKQLGPQAGTLITNTTFANFDISPIDESVFWVPDARPTFGRCKEFGHDPQCDMAGAKGLLEDAKRMRTLRTAAN